MIELLLVLAVIAIIATIAIPTALGGMATQRCAAGARLVLAHARHARYDAVQSGRRTRLVVDCDSATWFAERAGDPFSDPAGFGPAAGTWGQPSGRENVQVRGVRLGGLRRAMDETANPVSQGPAAIQFEPDGTATAAEVWLASGTGGDAPMLVVQVNGVTGGVRILTPEEAGEEAPWQSR